MQEHRPFIGSEAVASGALGRYEVRRYYRAIMPDIYLDKRIAPSLRQRIAAAWLWSGREAVISGLSAAALHGAKWIDDDSPVELIWRNDRAPQGVITRADLLLEGEVQWLEGLPVATPERAAFDLGRRGGIDDAVARLDALARATDVKVTAIDELAARHPHTRGLRKLQKVLDLVDSGAASPRETQLRLLLIRAGYPRPETQIPVLSLDARRQYYLDMGWRDLMLAVEYDGDQHRPDPVRFAYEIERAEDLRDAGWLVVRVAARNHPAEILRRVRRAWDARRR